MLLTHLVLFSFLGGATGATAQATLEPGAVVIQDINLSVVTIAANEIVVSSDESSVQHVAVGDDSSLLMVATVIPIARAEASYVVIETETTTTGVSGTLDVLIEGVA